jgi:hypothetical protein
MDSDIHVFTRLSVDVVIATGENQLDAFTQIANKLN